MIGKTKKRLFLATIERADGPAATLTIAARDFTAAAAVLAKKKLMPKVGEYRALRLEDQGYLNREADHDADELDAEEARESA